MKIDKVKAIQIGVVVLASVICLGSVTYAIGQKVAFRKERSSLLSEQQTQQEILKDAKDALEKSQKTGETSVSALDSVKTVGKEVSDVVNSMSAKFTRLCEISDKLSATNKSIKEVEELSKVDTSVNREGELQELKTKRDGVSKELQAIQKEILDNYSVELDKYFGKNSDLRTVWYHTNDTEGMQDVKWTFVPNFDVDSKKVLWLCRNKTDILAYVTAFYKESDNTFYDYDKRVTTAGAALVKGTEGLGENPVEKVDQNVDSILGSLDTVGLPDDYNKEYKESVDKESEEVVDDIKKNQSDLRKQLEEDMKKRSEVTK